MDTLEQIVDSSVFISPEERQRRIVAGQKLRAAASELLPFERRQITEQILDVTRENGYDETYPRVNIGAIASAKKRFGDYVLPAFAMYDIKGNGVDSQSVDCVIRANDLRLASQESSREKIVNKNMATAAVNGIATDIQRLARRANASSVYTFLITAAIGLISVLSAVYLSSATAACIVLPLIVLATPFLEINRQRSTLSESKIRCNIRIKHDFTGKIPDNIRREFLTAETMSKFDSIWLVEEAYDWKVGINASVTPIPVIRNQDPLLIGKVAHEFYLIAKFDVTPLEIKAITGELR